MKSNKPKFSFTIVDDTDLSTLDNVKPVYDLLISLGMRTTKTVWPLCCEDSSNTCFQSATLQDMAYASWIKDLQQHGFEIAFHGASASSNLREKTERGLEEFEKTLGFLPRMHINHHMNRDNLYWGMQRFDSAFVRLVIKLLSKHRRIHFAGHEEDSDYFWGDIFQETIRYCRNFTFPDLIDITEINPTLPYSDPNRPYVSQWFSSCDGGNPDRFVSLLRPENLARLVHSGGVCIVYTHFGAGFVSQGKVLPSVERALREVANLGNGCFLPASDLLDTLSASRVEKPNCTLPQPERQRMEIRWLWGKLRLGGTS